MAFYTGAAQLNLPRSPDVYAHQYFAMNAALPSLRPVDFLAWSTWRPNHRINSASSSAPLTPPMTSTFEAKSTSHIHASSSPPPPYSIHMQMDQPDANDHRTSSSSTILPPIAQLDRQIHSLPPLTPPEDDDFPSSRLPKIATIPPDADFFEPPRQPTSPISRRESNPAQLMHPQSLPTSPTPPNSHLQIPPQHISSSTSMDVSLPPPEVTPNTSAAAASIINTLALVPAPTSYMVDWLDFTRTRSAHFIAEKTCEMICYLWFSIPSHSRAAAKVTVGAESEAGADPLVPKGKNMSSVTSLQLVATPAFVSFMQKLLETTQVSQSVIVLSLHYIHRLKEKNAYTPAQSGSEFRIAVTGLMMANKFLDDNTYTNKTWSEVSGISLDEINRMEREFLLGVDFNLYVDKTTYASWLNLLKGLVLAKERDARRLLRGGGMRVPGSARRGVGSGREGRFWHPHHPHGAHPRFGNSGPPSKTYTAAHAPRRQSAHPAEEPAHPPRHRARSTSPRSFTFSSTGRSVAAPHVQVQQYTLNVPPQVRPEPQQEEQSAYSQQYYQPVQPTVSPAVPSMDYTYPSSPTPIRNLPVPELTPSTGTKRTAADAFASPPSSAFIPQQRRLRRPASLYGRLHTLQIPEFTSTSSASSSSVASSIPRHGTGNPSPLEGLGGFEKMNLDGEERAREQREAVIEERRQAKRARAEPPVSTVIPQTLMAAYSVDEANRAALPKNLFFYTLASSPNSDEKELKRERLRQLQSDRARSGSSDAMGLDAEPEPHFEPRARKAKLRCQAAQPVKYGYNYADLNAFAATRYAPLYSYQEPSSQSSAQGQRAYVSTSSTTPVSPTTARQRDIPHIVAYPHSHPESRQSHAMSSQPTAVPFPSTHGQLTHAAVVQSASASPASYNVAASDAAASCVLPHFRDDVWARTPLPAQPLQQQTQVPCQSPSVCVTGSGQVAGNKWFEGGRQKEEQVMDYSDSPAVQTTSSAAAHSAVHNSSPYRHRYASTNVSTSSSHPGSAASSPYYQQQQQNIRRQFLQDVPSAPFANAGPPGVGVQFYATPEVQQVHVQVPIPVQMPGVYNTPSYPTYSSSSTSTVNGSASTHFYSGSSHAVSHGPTYTYSGAHSTSNSPYHSAVSGSYRYTDYGYPGQNTSSSGYRY